MIDTVFKTNNNILSSAYAEILSPNDLVVVKGMNMKQVYIQKISESKTEVIIQIDEFNSLFDECN